MGAVIPSLTSSTCHVLLANQFKIYRYSIFSILSLDWTYLSDISCLHAQKKCNKTLQQLLYGLGVSDVQYTREYMSSSVLYGIGRVHLREKYTRQ